MLRKALLTLFLLPGSVHSWVLSEDKRTGSDLGWNVILISQFCVKTKYKTVKI
jgi:hypothetical protein